MRQDTTEKIPGSDDCSPPAWTPGMRVRWNDPDEGACSREGILKLVDYHNEELVRITMEDGWAAEVCPWELELLPAIE